MIYVQLKAAAVQVLSSNCSREPLKQLLMAASDLTNLSVAKNSQSLFNQQQANDDDQGLELVPLARRA